MAPAIGIGRRALLPANPEHADFKDAEKRLFGEQGIAKVGEKVSSKVAASGVIKQAGYGKPPLFRALFGRH
jgi:hypothetical protein